MTRRMTLCGMGMILMVAALCGTVLADDATINEAISTMAGITVEHEDAYPFKGLVSVTVTNNTGIDWGDFHFEIMEVPGWPSVENVDILTLPVPTSSQTLSSPPVVDNVVVGSTLDYYFYSDPVGNGQSVSFTFETDNTTSMVPVFGLLMYPTPVPEPGTISLIALGLGTMLLARRRK